MYRPIACDSCMQNYSQKLCREWALKCHLIFARCRTLSFWRKCTVTTKCRFSESQLPLRSLFLRDIKLCTSWPGYPELQLSWNIRISSISRHFLVRYYLEGDFAELPLTLLHVKDWWPLCNFSNRDKRCTAGARWQKKMAYRIIVCDIGVVTSCYQ